MYHLRQCERLVEVLRGEVDGVALVAPQRTGEEGEGQYGWADEGEVQAQAQYARESGAGGRAGQDRRGRGHGLHAVEAGVGGLQDQPQKGQKHETMEAEAEAEAKAEAETEAETETETEKRSRNLFCGGWPHGRPPENGGLILLCPLRAHTQNQKKSQ